MYLSRLNVLLVMLLILVSGAALVGCSEDGDTIITNTVVSPVAVSSVFPEEAGVGETITVKGQHFGTSQGTSTLSINGVDVTVISSWTDSQIVATVPSGAGTGNVTVTVNGVAGAPGFLIVPWEATNPENVAICTAMDNQYGSQLVTDGSGGAIVLWADRRSSTADIYAQRVDSSGTALWTTDGVAITNVTGNQYLPDLVADGNGGAIIAWTDRLNGSGDIYAQRINSSGTTLWAASDVVVNTTPSRSPRLVTDGNGGAIVIWWDSRAGFFRDDIYAQRLDSSGNLLWAIDGVEIVASNIDRCCAEIVADGSGGAIIIWSRVRFDGYVIDIRAQRVDSSGSVLWPADGVDIITVTGISDTIHFDKKLVADGHGGAIITWSESRNGATDIYAQRVDSSGSVLWATDGVAITTATGSQWYPELVADGNGGAIIAWEDQRNGISNEDIYAQRIDSNGNVLWAADGVAITSVVDNQSRPQLVTDGNGGAIIAWWDRPNGTSDIYAQRINSSGTALWALNGVAISTAADSQRFPKLVSDGSGGAIITWDDGRNGNLDIYGQGITASGRQ